MFRWKDAPRFKTGNVWPDGESPKEHHPAQWGKLELHRYGQMGPGIDGRSVLVAVHSTRRSRDGWSYNVAELKGRAAWVGYFHHGPTGQRILHRGTDNAHQLEQLFGLHHIL